MVKRNVCAWEHRAPGYDLDPFMVMPWQPRRPTALRPLHVQQGRCARPQAQPVPMARSAPDECDVIFT